MISDNTKKKIDALPLEVLQEEIDKGNQSRFQGEKYARLKKRLASLMQQENNKVREEDVYYKKEALALARKANKLSKVAIVVSVIIALVF